MKKRNITLMCILLALCIVAILVGCQPTPQQEQLSSPQNIRIEGDLLRWDRVENADGYVVAYNGNQNTVSGTMLTVQFPEESVNITFKIKAIPEEKSNLYKESNWSEFVYEYTYTPPQGGGNNQQGGGNNQQQTTPKLKYKLINNSMEYEVSIDCPVNDSSLAGEVIIPAYYKDRPVTRVADYAFCPVGSGLIINNDGSRDDTECNKVTTSIVLPDTIRDIGTRAFKDCLALVSINLPEGITEISTQFDGCSALKSITIPKSVTSLTQDFNDCVSLEDIQVLSTNLERVILSYDGYFYLQDTPWYNKQPDGFIVFANVLVWYKGAEEVKITSYPDNVEKIAGGAFSGSKVTSLIVPSDIEFLSFGTSAAFCKMMYLKEITFSEGITVIPNRLFYGSAIEELILPNTIVEIGVGVFESCQNLKKVLFSSSLKTVRTGAFRYTSIEHLVIPASVTTWGSDVFSGNIKTITFEEGCVEVSRGLIGNTLPLETVESITLASTIKTIKASGLSNCLSLKTLDLRNVEVIEQRGINGLTSLERIVLPSTITQLAEGAISNCTKLKEIVFSDGITEVPANFVNYCPELRKIVLPTSITKIADNFGINIEKFYANGSELGKIDISIYYKGTQEQWNNVSKPNCANFFANWIVRFYSATEPKLDSTGTAYDGNYWYYAQDGVTLIDWTKKEN